MKRITPIRYVAVTCVVVGFASLAWGATATVSKGTLCTTPGSASITDDTVAGWINAAVNATAKRLIVLTQCYGGNASAAFGGANTAVASATSNGQQAIYGGYDNGAAGAIKPQAGKTGADVHSAGVGNKAASETPTTGGGLPLNNFPMDPIGTNNIESRHIIVYAGQPNAVDVAQRNTVKANNANTPPTSTVATVGGAGGGGWDQPGTAAGLKKAIDDAGALINASPNPSREQLILFVTDHGDLHKTQTRTVTVPASTPNNKITDIDPSNGNPTQNGLRTFSASTSSPSYLDPNSLIGATPSFSTFFDLSLLTGINQPASLGSINSLIQPGLWSMDVLPHGGPSDGITTTLFNPTLLPLDFNGNGIIGDQSGEGVTMEFLVTSPFMINSFFDVFAELSLDNGTGNTWLVSNPSQDSGAVAKGLPEPSSLAMLSLGAMFMIRRRRAA